MLPELPEDLWINEILPNLSLGDLYSLALTNWNTFHYLSKLYNTNVLLKDIRRALLGIVTDTTKKLIWNHGPPSRIAYWVLENEELWKLNDLIAAGLELQRWMLDKTGQDCNEEAVKTFSRSDYLYLALATAELCNAEFDDELFAELLKTGKVSVELANSLLEQYNIAPGDLSLLAAAEEGNVSLFKNFVEKCQVVPKRKHLRVLAEQGCTDLVREYIQRYYGYTQDILRAMAEAGNVELVQELLEEVTPGEGTVAILLKVDVDLALRLIEEYSIDPYSMTILTALEGVASGQPFEKVVTTLDVATHELVFRAIEEEREDLTRILLERLLRQGCLELDDVMDAAMANGRQQLAEWLLQQLSTEEISLRSAIMAGRTSLAREVASREDVEVNDIVTAIRFDRSALARELEGQVEEDIEEEDYQFLFQLAIEYDRDNLIQYYEGQVEEITTDHVHAALDNERYVLAMRLLKELTEFETEDMEDVLAQLLDAAHGEELFREALENIRERQVELPEMVLEPVIEQGYHRLALDLLDEFEANRSALPLAIENGFLDVVDKLLEQGVEPGPADLALALDRGYNSLALRLANDYGVSLNPRAVQVAAREGFNDLARRGFWSLSNETQIEVLKRLIKDGQVELVNELIPGESRAWHLGCQDPSESVTVDATVLYAALEEGYDNLAIKILRKLSY